MNPLAKSIIILGMLLASGCYYDKFNELYPLKGYVETCDPELPDTYTAVIKNVILINCYSCHNKNRKDGGISLETLQQVKEIVATGKFIGAVQQQNGFKAMPPNSRLRDCDLNQIQQWIDAGMPE